MRESIRRLKAWRQARSVTRLEDISAPGVRSIKDVDMAARKRGVAGSAYLPSHLEVNSFEDDGPAHH